MPVSFVAIVYRDAERGLCIVYMDSVAHLVTDEKFQEFAAACCGENVRKLEDPDGLIIEGYTCEKSDDPMVELLTMWALADLSFRCFGTETHVHMAVP
jgi:hypothetical protein